jgi:uncharacterized C2H2 Zn-finger protein
MAFISFGSFHPFVVVSGQSTSSMSHVSRPAHRSPSDLAYILNDVPAPNIVGEKRKPPEVGTSSPVNLSQIKRRRGSHVDPPVPLDARTITCAFHDCGVVLANERSTVAAHVNSAHTSEGSANKTKILCRWRNAWGEECRTQVASNGLFRHVLDKHTSLLLTLCPTCGKSFRRDSLGRHAVKCRGL